ncbi:hypothetical protein D3C81_1487020 [compost metagenome]
MLLMLALPPGLLCTHTARIYAVVRLLRSWSQPMVMASGRSPPPRICRLTAAALKVSRGVTVQLKVTP